MSKKVVISGYYGFENFGDEAILKVLTDELKTNNFDITVFSKNPNFTADKLGVNSIYTFSINKIINEIKESDVLISGGGSLLQDTTSIKSLFYYLFIIATAQILKKDVVIFAQGIGPINNKLGQLITKNLLKNCKYITVRDKKSYSLLKQWNLNPDLVTDPVWNLPTQDYKPNNKIGVQLRKWNTLSTAYLKKLASAIIEKFPQKEIIIYSFQDALDLETCQNFEKILKEIDPNTKTNVQKAMSIDRTIEAFSELEYLIAMRYHACLLGLKYGTKTLALSYDEKVEKIAHRFEIPCSFLNANENISSLINEMQQINSEKIKEKTKDCMFSFTKTIDSIR